MKTVSIPLVLLAMASAALANTAPTVVIQSAAMRPGTTLMDVVYRVNDPDNATVKTRALAFVDGVRSFANLLKYAFSLNAAGPDARVLMVGGNLGFPAITLDSSGPQPVLRVGFTEFRVPIPHGRASLPW